MFSFTFYLITEMQLWLAQNKWKYCKYRFNYPLCLIFTGSVGLSGVGGCLGFFLVKFTIKSRVLYIL